MQFIQSVLALIVTLGILVTIHEYGHFWVARRCGVKVLRFSVGFGKPIFSRYDRHGTEYAVAAIPLGGYVKMLDEREAPVDPAERHMAFTSKPPSQRIAIAAAGPLANFIFAIAAYWLLSVVGVTTVAPIVGEVDPDSVAARIGLAPGMEIESVDGRSVQSWPDISKRLLERVGESDVIDVGVLSGGTDRILSGSLDGWGFDEDKGDPIGSFGIMPKRADIPAVIGQLLPDQRAQAAGLKEGDRILAVNGESVKDWSELVTIIQAAPETSLRFEVERDGREETLDVTPAERLVDGQAQGYIGAGVQPVPWPDDLLREVRYGAFAAVPVAVTETWSDIRLTVVAIQKMITGLLSPTNLSGPITIARVAEASASSSFEDFIHFLAYLSVTLGVLNLLPVPVLDGGHIVFYTYEAIRGKPVSVAVQNAALQIGMALILTLMVFALYNDLMRL